MRRLAILATLLSLTACGIPFVGSNFAQPNKLMGREIRARVTQIPYQHRQELLDNMLWLATKAGEQAIPMLLEGLNDKEAKVRSSCAWVLCKINDKRVIPYLQQKVKDPHESVRLEVARSLVYLGDMQQIPGLIKGLDSELLPVRYNCHMALRDSTKRDFGYDHLTESDHQRKKAVLSWWEWWGEQSGDPWFAKNYAKDNGLQMDGKPEGKPQGMLRGQGSTTPPMPSFEAEPQKLPTPVNVGGQDEGLGEDPFKELPEFEEINLGGVGTQEKPTSRKSK